VIDIYTPLNFGTARLPLILQGQGAGMEHNSTLDYVVNLHKKNTDALGFIPYPTVEKFILNDQICMTNEGGLNASFCLFGSGKGSSLKIYQHCVEQDLRMLDHGKRLFNLVTDKAREKGYDNIQLRCRENLEANKFWKALGFKNFYFEKKITKRTNKGINHWCFKIKSPQQYFFNWGGH